MISKFFLPTTQLVESFNIVFVQFHIKKTTTFFWDMLYTVAAIDGRLMPSHVGDSARMLKTSYEPFFIAHTKSIYGA